jgi:GTPase
MRRCIALVGRPNVGKSTLFNRLTRSRDALVADYPGLTRDRQYGQGHFNEQPFWVIDTGGYEEQDDHALSSRTREQIQLALDEADTVFFLVDTSQGLTPDDHSIASWLRESAHKVFLLVNKSDGQDENIACADFFSLGFKNIIPISATQGRNCNKLLEKVFGTADEENSRQNEEGTPPEGIRIACVGRPNAGKSTLTNRLLGEDRMMVSDVAGTTRDSIFVPYEHEGQAYTLIDTAGMRKRSKVDDLAEQFSVMQTLKAIDHAHVVLYLCDAQREISEQDLRLLGLVMQRGTAVVLVINKWDNLDDEQKTRVKDELERRLPFLDFARRYFISALHGSGVGKLYRAIHEAYDNQQQKPSTSELTRLLERAIEQHQPPLASGRRIRLRYAHFGGHHPFTIVIHGKQTEKLLKSYQRYLVSFYRKALRLTGVPVIVKLVSDHNPFDPKNKERKASPEQD